jgi:LmbE family N-acetylglucosaminyl deacetylase
MNRDHIRELMAQRPPEITEIMDENDRRDVAENDDFGSPEQIITHAVDVRAVIDRKRASMVAHASQIGPDTFFLKLPDDAFRQAFGTEWYIEAGARREPETPFATDLLDRAV